MTLDEAIKELHTIRPRGGIIPQKRAEALDVAIQALEKQMEMKKYCDEHSCTYCPYHNTSLNYNRCMNDFIIDKE
mgnify:FL=1